MKGPLNDIKLLTCGGVTPENFGEYVGAGIDGIGIGNGLFRREWIENKEHCKIRETALKYS